MAEKPKKVLILSGKGIAKFPHLNSPDTKFKEDGEYHVKLVQSSEVAAKNVSLIDKMMEQSLAEAKADPANKGKKIKQADTPYQVDEETGEVSFTYKTKASGKKKDGTPWSRSLAIYDAQGVALKKAPNIGGGSELIVSFEPSTFYTKLVGAGVTLRLEAVQIIKLVEWGGRDAKSFGFGKEEGGYSAEESGEQFPTSTETASEEEDDSTEEETKNAADF